MSKVKSSIVGSRSTGSGLPNPAVVFIAPSVTGPTITWVPPTVPAGTVLGFNVYRRPTSSSGSWGSPLNNALLAANVTSFQDMTGTADIDYSYLVTSDYESGGAVTPSSYKQIPAPTGLAVTAGNGQLLTSWTSPAGETAGTLIEWQISAAGDWPNSHTVAHGTASYTITGLTNGQAYDVRATAIGNHNGAVSSNVTGTPVLNNFVFTSSNYNALGSPTLSGTSSQTLTGDGVDYNVGVTAKAALTRPQMLQFTVNIPSGSLWVFGLSTVSNPSAGDAGLANTRHVVMSSANDQVLVRDIGSVANSADEVRDRTFGNWQDVTIQIYALPLGTAYWRIKGGPWQSTIYTADGFKPFAVGLYGDATATLFAHFVVKSGTITVSNVSVTSVNPPKLKPVSMDGTDSINHAYRWTIGFMEGPHFCPALGGPLGKGHLRDTNLWHDSARGFHLLHASDSYNYSQLHQMVCPDKYFPLRWDPYPNGPVLSVVGRTGTYDESAIQLAHILYNPAAGDGKVIRCHYAAGNVSGIAGGACGALAHATSLGDVLTRDTADVTGLTGGSAAPGGARIVLSGGTYYWISGATQVKIVTAPSLDGPWTFNATSLLDPEWLACGKVTVAPQIGDTTITIDRPTRYRVGQTCFLVESDNITDQDMREVHILAVNGSVLSILETLDRAFTINARLQSCAMYGGARSDIWKDPDCPFPNRWLMMENTWSVGNGTAFALNANYASDTGTPDTNQAHYSNFREPCSSLVITDAVLPASGYSWDVVGAGGLCCPLSNRGSALGGLNWGDASIENTCPEFDAATNLLVAGVIPQGAAVGLSDGDDAIGFWNCNDPITGNQSTPSGWGTHPLTPHGSFAPGPSLVGTNQSLHFNNDATYLDTAVDITFDVNTSLTMACVFQLDTAPDQTHSHTLFSLGGGGKWILVGVDPNGANTCVVRIVIVDGVLPFYITSNNFGIDPTTRHTVVLKWDAIRRIALLSVDGSAWWIQQPDSGHAGYNGISLTNGNLRVGRSHNGADYFGSAANGGLMSGVMVATRAWTNDLVTSPANADGAIAGEVTRLYNTGLWRTAQSGGTMT